VEGDDPTQTFTVQIQKDSNISALRKLIKEEKKPLFDSVPADTLQLFKVREGPTQVVCSLTRILAR
jgi:hypothetical protein